MRHYARKIDTTQTAIVNAVRAAGWQVFFIREPADLLCFKAGIWRVLECKSPRNKRGDPKRDKRQAKQDAFLAATNTPCVTTPEAALAELDRPMWGGQRAAA